MCARGRKFFCLSALLLLLSSLAFAQAGGSPLPVPDFSESSPESLEQLLSAPPTTPDVQIKPGMTLEQRQAATLQAWIEYYKAVTIWQESVKASWSKAKSSYEKADSARVKQIESRDIQIAALKEQLKQAQAAAWIAGIGGAVTGFIVDRIVSR